MTTPALPHHIAIIMDGNGRWAKQRLMPRAMGHRAGVKSVRRAIDYCGKKGIRVLSLFTLSVENFLHRPESEVQFLCSLLSDMLTNNIDELDEKKVCIRIIGNITIFPDSLQQKMIQAIERTKNNDKLILVLALNYSGRWDILQAAKKFALTEKSTVLSATEKDFQAFLSLADLPEPDLLIRTSGEQRISNFFLWQLAYTELFFTPVFWPDFDENVFDEALSAYQKRERRFGLTGEQLC